ncbi:response regulator [Duganella callida]|uniref:Response regulator n=1 Tax=Duganella callida TaxID=2561932 RepID=A0A4Y9SFG0_9BURK|nr:response regulator [Duganella callida]TFW19966.1 response regulator [Duganella callida]
MRVGRRGGHWGTMLKKILVIDDNVETANVLVALLELNGHHASAAYGAADGLRAVDELTPDVVFLDIGMPEMNGYQVAGLIRARPRIRQPYLIAFSAWDDAASVARALGAGFDRHIAKTSSFEILYAAVRDLNT